MEKTITTAMVGVINAMKDNKKKHSFCLSEENYSKAKEDLSFLQNSLNMTRIQIIILTVIMNNNGGDEISYQVLSDRLNLNYLELVSYSNEIEGLRDRGYVIVRKTYSGNNSVRMPKDVRDSLISNKPYILVEGNNQMGTGDILIAIKRLLANTLEKEVYVNKIWKLFEQNPETSISKATKKYLKDIDDEDERFLYIVLIYKFWFVEDDFANFNEISSYFDEKDIMRLRRFYKAKSLDLQTKKIIEEANEDGYGSRDYFKLSDKIKNEIFEDVGGFVPTKRSELDSHKIKPSDISEKRLFYNPGEEKKVAELRGLLEDKKIRSIMDKLKKQGFRTGFTCLFYGSPGTGKTETVYQLAKQTDRELLCVDVAKIKSCWVGESEKNIRALFSDYKESVKRAQITTEKVPILLFNEADAIFGVRSSKAEKAVDKMENSIQNIILQEMEDLDGILIATTNLTTTLDKAFERRFLYKIQFSQPSKEVKGKIWKSMIPELTEDQSEELASQFDFSGGQIENIARKRLVFSLINNTEPSFQQLVSYCQDERIKNPVTETRKIGF